MKGREGKGRESACWRTSRPPSTLRPPPPPATTTNFPRRRDSAKRLASAASLHAALQHCAVLTSTLDSGSRVPRACHVPLGFHAATGTPSRHAPPRPATPRRSHPIVSGCLAIWKLGKTWKNQGNFRLWKGQRIIGGIWRFTLKYWPVRLGGSQTRLGK